MGDREQRTGPRAGPEQDWRLRLTGLVVVGVGFVLGAVIPEPPRTLRGWLLVAAGALVAVLLFQLSKLQKWPPRWAGGQFRRRRTFIRKTVMTLGVILLLALAIGFGASRLSELGEGAWIRLAGCPHPTALRMLSSPEGLDPASILAAEYEDQTKNRNHGCPTVDVHVYDASAKDTRDALAAGWSNDYFRIVGPRPDLWLADSGSDVGRVRASNSGGIMIRGEDNVATSPIVVGIAGSAGQQELTWTEFRQAALLRKDLDVVRPDPRTSTTGEVATALLYGIEQPVDVVEGRAIEQRIGQSLDQGGYPFGDSLQLLCRHRQLATPPSAVIVSEQALVRFNKGDPLGGECATRVAPAAADRVLRAFYPPDTRGLDHWLVRFSSYPAQEREAADFGSWLTDGEGKRALVRAGLRPPEFTVGEPLSEEYGVRQGVTFIRHPIGSDVLSSTLRLYDDAYRPGRVLLALDASGSMGAAAGADRSRFDIVSQGAQHALGLIGDRDEFGLRFFPAGESVPIGRLTGPDGTPRQEATAAALSRTTPNGVTPLFQAIVDGAQEVGPSSAERVSALVVLTDGENTPNGVTLDQVRDTVQRAGVRIFVIAVGETRCTSEALRVLTAETGGACHDADFDSVENSLEKVFGALWKGY